MTSLILFAAGLCVTAVFVVTGQPGWQIAVNVAIDLVWLMAAVKEMGKR